VHTRCFAELIKFQTKSPQNAKPQKTHSKKLTRFENGIDGLLCVNSLASILLAGVGAPTYYDSLRSGAIFLSALPSQLLDVQKQKQEPTSSTPILCLHLPSPPCSWLGFAGLAVLLSPCLQLKTRDWKLRFGLTGMRWSSGSGLDTLGISLGAIAIKYSCLA
jgi:hypothetical protein